MNTDKNRPIQNLNTQNGVHELTRYEEAFHPISWLQSVGQFIGENQTDKCVVSNDGYKSVRAAMV